MLQDDLTQTLSHYGIKGAVRQTFQGPLLDIIEFEPEVGTKFKNIAAVLPDAARELGVASLRAESIEGTKNLGFEFPRTQPETVDFVKLLNSEAFGQAKGALPICLGVDIRGVPQFADLAKMPHLLVAGTTGSGKSVGLNSFVLSLIARKTPQELKLVMIDPKRIEFATYNNQKYMLMPVVTETADAVEALQSLVDEMERRYGWFDESLTKNIADYNLSGEGKKLPYLVCVIDEFADLMAADKKVSALVQRLAQKARAAGIHLIMATQRPSVDVVTGVLKANFPTRLAYKVASSADSRTILDATGAEDLIGRGDALFLAGDGRLKRVHGAYATDEQIAELLKPYRAEVKPLKKKAEDKTGRTGAVENIPVKKNCVFEFWCSLKSGERKTIISWVLSMLKWGIKTFFGKGKRR